MDVGGWLRTLGLGQYEAVFRASEIDADILPKCGHPRGFLPKRDENIANPRGNRGDALMTWIARSARV